MVSDTVSQSPKHETGAGDGFVVVSAPQDHIFSKVRQGSTTMRVRVRGFQKHSIGGSTIHGPP